jgi:hypothetical protein
MAFVVEDGSGLTTATSYVSIAEADAYTSELGLTAWTGTTSAKQTALIKAQRYITQVYRGVWKGVRKTELQSLDWPRLDVMDVDGYDVDSESVPAPIKEAQIELAVKALTAELLSDVATDASNIASETSTVGPVSYAVSYTGGKASQKSYATVSLLLEPYIVGAGEIVRG